MENDRLRAQDTNEPYLQSPGASIRQQRLMDRDKYSIVINAQMHHDVDVGLQSFYEFTGGSSRPGTSSQNAINRQRERNKKIQTQLLAESPSTYKVSAPSRHFMEGIVPTNLIKAPLLTEGNDVKCAKLDRSFLSSKSIKPASEPKASAHRKAVSVMTGQAVK